SLTWCDANPMHVYSGHRKQCTWCELTRVTGYDPFPNRPNIRARSFDIAIGRFRQAYQTDLVRALRMVDRNPRLAKVKDLAAMVREVDAARKEVQTIEPFRRELNKADTERNDMALIEQLEKNPRLPGLLRKSGAVDVDKLDQLESLRGAVGGLQGAI